jgi:hypothetical protein
MSGRATLATERIRRPEGTHRPGNWRRIAAKSLAVLAAAGLAVGLLGMAAAYVTDQNDRMG